MIFDSVRQMVTGAVVAILLGGAAQAATVEATVSGLIGRPGNQFGDASLLNMNWSWDQTTGEVQSVSLSVSQVEVGGQDVGSYVANNLTVTSSTVSIIESSFFRQFHADWEFSVSGAPRVTENTSALQDEALTVIRIRAWIGSQSTLDGLSPFSAEFGNPLGGNGIPDASIGGPKITFVTTDSRGRDTRNDFDDRLRTANYNTNVSAVPLPAGLPFLLVGLGALVLVRVRN